MTIDILIKNANEVLPMTSNGSPLCGKEMSQIKPIINGSVAISGEKIFYVGSSENLDNLNITDKTKIIDAKGKTVLPGFVDSHTHLVFGGTREFEFVAKIEKLRQTKNVTMKGGIGFTVDKTRRASKKDLVDLAKPRLKRMLENGITTVESKSGYGLDLENEIKILEVNQELNKIQNVEIESTFLGAHTVPNGMTSEEYTEKVIEMIPIVAEKKLARFCDVFCEEGFFSKEQSKRILLAGKDYGLIPKVHADQLTNTYGADLAAEVGAVSADHLDYAYEDGLKRMAEKKVVAVLLPAVSFSMDLKYIDARKMLEMNLPIAVSTDFNPGAGHCESMFLSLTLACLKQKMLPIEALAAATINGAYACGVADKVGSLEIGKQADILILDAPNHDYIPYHYGINHVNTVIKKGKVVLKR